MYLIVDFIMNLLLVVGKNVILVVCDRLSKMAHFVIIVRETGQKSKHFKFLGNPRSIV